MSAHTRFQDMLARRQELASQEEARLAEHLAGCPDCRAVAADYAEQRTLVRSVSYAEPPARLRAGVLQAASAAPVATAPGWRRFRPAGFAPRFVLPPLGAALIAGVVVFAVVHPGGQSPSHPAALGRATATAPVTFGPARRITDTAHAPITSHAGPHPTHAGAGHSGTATPFVDSIPASPLLPPRAANNQAARSQSPAQPTATQVQSDALKVALGASTPVALPTASAPALRGVHQPPRSVVHPVGTASTQSSSGAAAPAPPVTGGGGPATAPRPTAAPRPTVAVAPHPPAVAATRVAPATPLPTAVGVIISPISPPVSAFTAVAATATATPTPTP